MEPTASRPTILEREAVLTSRGRFTYICTGPDLGALLVLLHPLAMSADFWTPLARELGRKRPVVSLDARGHGNSEWNGRPFTVEDMADDVAAVVEEVNGSGGPVDVLGMSMGGCVAQAFALRRPDLVDRLVLADTTSCYGPDRVTAWEARARRAADVPRQEQLEFQVHRWFTDEFVRQQPDEVNRVVGVFLATDSAAHAAAARAMGGFDATGALGRIEADTLVLVGEDDYATPPEMARVLAEGIPSARLVVVPGARHASLLERRDTWPTVAAHFRDAALSETPAPPAG